MITGCAHLRETYLPACPKCNNRERAHLERQLAEAIATRDKALRCLGDWQASNAITFEQLRTEAAEQRALRVRAEAEVAALKVLKNACRDSRKTGGASLLILKALAALDAKEKP